MSHFLHLLENEVHHAALAFMVVVNALRLGWMFRFRSRREKAWPAGKEGAGIAFSLANIVRPGAMESIRAKPFFYVQFVLFHLGVVTAIAETFIIPSAPEVLRVPGVAWTFRMVMAAAFVVGLLRLVRRFRNKAVRFISSADDYFSLVLVILFFGAAFLAVWDDFQRSQTLLLVFFSLTVVFLIYEPFSKIIHYLYYPFTHFFLGRSLGRRGVYPLRPHPDKDDVHPGTRPATEEKV